MNQRTRRPARRSWCLRPGALLLAACALLSACHTTTPAGSGHIQAPGPMTGHTATRHAGQAEQASRVWLPASLPARVLSAGAVPARHLGGAADPTIYEGET